MGSAVIIATLCSLMKSICSCKASYTSDVSNQILLFSNSTTMDDIFEISDFLISITYHIQSHIVPRIVLHLTVLVVESDLDLDYCFVSHSHSYCYHRRS